MVEMKKRNRLSPDMNGIGTFTFHLLVLRMSIDVESLLRWVWAGTKGGVQRQHRKLMGEGPPGSSRQVARKEDTPLH